jgi:hypothetical protein
MDRARSMHWRTSCCGCREQCVILPIDQGLVELEQGGWPQDGGELRDAVRADEQRGQAEHEPIERGEIRRALLAAIADQPLVLEEQRFGGDGADAPGTQNFREGHEE